MAINPQRLRALVQENAQMLRSHSRPLSERLPIPPVAARTLDQHLLWLDVCALEQTLSNMQARLDKTVQERAVCFLCLNTVDLPETRELRRALAKRPVTRTALQEAAQQRDRDARAQPPPNPLSPRLRGGI